MNIEERVINIINNVLGVKVHINDAFTDLYVDDIDLVDIINDCEEEFGYLITDDKVQNLETVSNLVNMIKDLDSRDYE